MNINETIDRLAKAKPFTTDKPYRELLLKEITALIQQSNKEAIEGLFQYVDEMRTEFDDITDVDLATLRRLADMKEFEDLLPPAKGAKPYKKYLSSLEGKK